MLVLKQIGSGLFAILLVLVAAWGLVAWVEWADDLHGIWFFLLSPIGISVLFLVTVVFVFGASWAKIRRTLWPS